MPLDGLIVLTWLAHDHPGDYDLMVRYTKWTLWGIAPSILFFVVALSCFSKHLALPVVLAASFVIWLIGAFFHHLLLRQHGAGTLV